MVETVAMLLFGLALTGVSASCAWAFIRELPTYKWASDFGLGAASVLMLLVGLTITVCALLYLVTGS